MAGDSFETVKMLQRAANLERELKHRREREKKKGRKTENKRKAQTHTRTLSTASRRVIVPLGASPPPMALQRSEFEDFANAYRPSSDAPPRKEEPPPKTRASDEGKVDFGKSLKRLMKKTPASPNVTNKSQKKEAGSQRVPLDRDLGNELKIPTTSHVKKASKPIPVQVDSSSAQSPTFQQRSAPVVSTATAHPAAMISDPKGVQVMTKVETSSKNGAKTKTDKGASQERQRPPDVMLQQQAPIVRPPSPCPTIPPKVPAPEPPKDMHKTTSSLPSTPTERDAHCLVVPRHIVSRFLPPRKNQDPLMTLRLVEIPERKYRVIMEFEESRALQKASCSPSGLYVDDPDNGMSKDYWDQLEAFNWTKQNKLAAMGMLLANVEKRSDFPYVTYLVVGGGRNEFLQKMNHVRSRPLPPEHSQLHFVAGYEEAVTVCRPPYPAIPEKPSSNRSGYVISLYQVLPGDDCERFEQNWVTWSGARHVYCHAPDYMGLKRISIHKSVLPSEIIIYVLVCEFTAIMDHLLEACVLVDRLRARCCGFSGIYRVLDVL